MVVLQEKCRWHGASVAAVSAAVAPKLLKSSMVRSCRRHTMPRGSGFDGTWWLTSHHATRLGLRWYFMHDVTRDHAYRVWRSETE